MDNFLVWISASSSPLTHLKFKFTDSKIKKLQILDKKWYIDRVSKRVSEGYKVASEMICWLSLCKSRQFILLGSVIDFGILKIWPLVLVETLLILSELYTNNWLHFVSVICQSLEGQVWIYLWPASMWQVPTQFLAWVRPH